jgi:hypothetical protein
MLHAKRRSGSPTGRPTAALKFDGQSRGIDAVSSYRRKRVLLTAPTPLGNLPSHPVHIPDTIAGSAPGQMSEVVDDHDRLLGGGRRIDDSLIADGLAHMSWTIWLGPAAPFTMS